MSQAIEQLAALLEARCDEVQAWFAKEHAQTPPSFYSSVDLRHSGAKLVPVDTNLFPAGFNNLSPAARERAQKQIRAFCDRQDMDVKKVVIIPENHTRNLGYLANLKALKGLFEAEGMEVRIGNLTAECEPLELELADNSTMIQVPLLRDGNTLHTKEGFVPDMIVINNDMTAGSPEILRGVTQLIAPQTGFGWYRRRKTIHFEAYAHIAARFAQQFDLDVWHFTAGFHKCGRIAFKERKGIECVALGVDKLMRRLREEYAAHGIEQEPYAYIKADSGTYGMGIMTARSGDEVVEMNKKTRNKMQTIKDSTTTSEVIIQEGIPTIDTVEGNPAEPMIYLVNGQAIGGAMRVNKERDGEGNLNARGMYFVPLCDVAEDVKAIQMGTCSFSPHGVIAQLATLAAAREEYGDSYSI